MINSSHIRATIHRRHRAGGFTLVELLAVVAMVGILAAISMVGYREYVNSARVADAKSVIGGIRISEESYRAETLTYLSCSDNLLDYYPMATPGKTKWHFHNVNHTDYPCWRMLSITTDSPTTFGFAVVAGAPAANPPTPNTTNKPTWPATTTEPWFVIQAAGNIDEDAKQTLLLASSFTGEIYVENEGE